MEHCWLPGYRTGPTAGGLSCHHGHHSFPIAFFWRVNFSIFFCSELRLLDSNFLGKVAESSSVEEIAVGKSIFIKMKCFIEMLTSAQPFEGK